MRRRLARAATFVVAALIAGSTLLMVAFGAVALLVDRALAAVDRVRDRIRDQFARQLDERH